jgi:6-phosphogluconate dehydrogenase (decarboxylating)
MGYAMAERLAKGGCDIAVWNRTKEKAEPLAKYGAKVANQLRAVHEDPFSSWSPPTKREGGDRQGACLRSQ